jgi:sucrose-6-phosphate hydrolase SacC (GH32 family)
MADSTVTATRSFEAEKRYLNLPVRGGAPMRRVTVSLGDEVRHTFTIELADGEPQWWAFLDLGSFSGESITVALEGEDSPALDTIHQSDEIVGAEATYREARRPQLRFSSRRGWLNDPNGLVFHDGEYHLFYQHNPYGAEWGNMHWGHAVSPDLVHWQELPIALYPDELGAMFSGSAVVDWNNTAGLQEGAEPPLIAIYTAAGQPFSQCIAVSNDRGRTLQKYSGNPVVPSTELGSRDPKVIWHAPTGKWVMALYLDWYEAEKYPGRPILEVLHEINSYAIYTSPDLKHWQKSSEFMIPDDAECPELFELPISGTSGDSRWIVFGAEGRYVIGAFDGETFTPESERHVLNNGDCFYAAQTFTDIPASDGRRILIPWGETKSPLFAEMPFGESMGLPIELTLHRTDDGLRIFANPVRELAALRTSTTRIAEQALRVGENPLASLAGELWEIEADIAVGDASRLVVDVRGVPVSYDVERREITCGDRTASLELIDGRIRLRVFVDRTAIDVFGNDGRLYMPMGVDLTGGEPTLSLRAEGGDAVIRTLEVHELASAWD